MTVDLLRQSRSSAHAAPETQTGMAVLDSTLRARMAEFSRAERRLASYFLENINGLQFETGASLARAVGVSEMTVSRFVRAIGFENLRALKRSLRPEIPDVAHEIDDHMARFQLRNAEQAEKLGESLRLELDAIVKAYALTGNRNWDDAADAIEGADVVYVIGFQASKGLAMDFASRLLWVRPRVVFVHNDSGTFGEVLMANPDKSVVVLIDTANYATRAIKLAERLKTLGMPLVIITDKYSLWAWSYSRWVFEAHTYVKTFWDSTAGIAVIANLMLDSVATRLGSEAKANFQKMTEAGRMLGEFVDRQGLGRSG